MKWKLMSDEELHSFGIEVILEEIEKEGIEIEEINPHLKSNPQIVGYKNGSLVFIFVRTACFPYDAKLENQEYIRCLEWSESKGAIPYFASVGLACGTYPDKTPIKNEMEMRLPIFHGGFAVRFPGLELMKK